MTELSGRRIVIVDPKPFSDRRLAFILEEGGYQVVRAGTAAAGLAAVAEQDTAAVLLEAAMPDLEGVQLCQDLRARRFTGPVIFVSQPHVAYVHASKI
ncbi:MAG TPA: response regulator [Thermomicrobiaceae bacterium]|nr:response regulator [Thermomicrobiaceae bacterium]